MRIKLNNFTLIGIKRKKERKWPKLNIRRWTSLHPKCKLTMWLTAQKVVQYAKLLTPSTRCIVMEQDQHRGWVKDLRVNSNLVLLGLTQVCNRTGKTKLNCKDGYLPKLKPTRATLSPTSTSTTRSAPTVSSRHRPVW